ncbi:fasciclin domain-containing protein [Salegentibacter sp.]|uniref:fasciclin domain-containing protein n=1 Tax=Salegentibacter sp. TaxID=1903072 RepID=UPI0039C992D9
MKNLKLMGIFFLMLGASSFAQTSNKTIVENASVSQEHTTLVAAIKAAELVETLQGDGPFTVFAPTNAAFDKLPSGTVETLLKPENKEQLQEVLTYHVISGNFSADDIIAAINEGNGETKFETVNGSWISAMIEDEKVKLQDVAGNVATVTMADLNQKNGVIHVIDTVVLPGK